MFAFPRLQTPRLNLRLLTSDDADEVFRHFADPGVTRFLDIDPLTSVDEARKIIDFHTQDRGCRWGLFCRATKILVGTCGYHAWKRGPPASAEIGFDLARAHWGIGLMREALAPVIAVGFGPMDLSRIEATVEPVNARSVRTLAALGFAVEAEPRDGLLVYVRVRPGP